MLLRRAGPADAELLLRWANDPVTRAAGFHPAPIEPETHRRWLGRRLASASDVLLIAVDDEEPVGHIRLERGQEGRVEIGIAVAPEARGRGLGRIILAAALESARADPDLDPRTFVARIRTDNPISLALFAGAGFQPAGQAECVGVPCFVYELDA